MPSRLPALVILVVVAGCDEPASTETALPATAPATATVAATPPAPVEPASAKPPPERIAAQHVLVAYRGAKRAPRTVTRNKAQAKKLAAEVQAKAAAGELFEKLAEAHSDDAQSKVRRGSVGSFKRDEMAKPFADAAFALKVGGVSEVVETPFGFHVIKRNQ